MASIVSTIKLVSSNLFPSPVNFTVQATDTVGGDAAFSIAVLDNTAGTPTQTIYGPLGGPAGTSLVTYIYLNASSSNTAPVLVNMTNSSAQTIAAMKLLPGDFAWFPVFSDDAGVAVELENTSAIVTGKQIGRAHV